MQHLEAHTVVNVKTRGNTVHRLLSRRGKIRIQYAGLPLSRAAQERRMLARPASRCSDEVLKNDFAKLRVAYEHVNKR